MSRYPGQVLDEYKRPVPGASIYVYKWDAIAQVAGDLETLTDDVSAPLINPLVSDADGLFYFNSTNGVKLIEYHYGGKLQFREQIILTPAGSYPGNDAALRADLAAPSGFTLVMHKSSQSSTFARTGTAWARLGGIDDNNLFNFIDPLLDDHILDGSNATPLHAYIQTALDTGRLLRAPSGVYLIASTLGIHLNDSGMIGSGAGDIHDTGTPIVAPCRLLWGGASGGTLVQAKSSSTQYIAGNKFGGMFLDGNSGLAAVGLNLVGCRLGRVEVVGAHTTTALLKMEPDTALSEPQGCSENIIERLTGYQINVGDGALLLETGTASYNCSQNLFQLISGDFRNGYAIDIQGSDSETFEVVKLYATLAAAVGVRLKGGASVNQAARNNMFHYLAVTNATVPVLAAGTESGDASPSVENNISFLDTANNPNLPTIGTGATLWWGTVKSPLGLRSYAAAAGSMVQQAASGLIVQSGVSSSIAAGGNQAITLTKALSANPTNVTITPKTAGMLHHATCTTTTLTITNDGGSSTDFYWRVEGI